MELSPDSTIIWRWGPFSLTATIVYTWVVMLVLLLMSLAATRKLSVEPRISRWQNALEAVVGYIRQQIGEVMGQSSDRYLPFIGTLFLFISLSNLLVVVPGYHAPTGSLSTTAALALSVFFAVPLYSISQQGLLGYLKHYIKPTIFMLPFHILSELTRTLTLAVRLFGSIMSEFLIAGVLLSLVPFFLPVIMKAFGLLLGQIQAYIFAILATVYIASALGAKQRDKQAVI